MLFCDRRVAEPNVLDVDQAQLPDVLSYFKITPTSLGAPDCPTRTRYLPIEPLAVALRHPKFPCWVPKPRVVRGQLHSNARPLLFSTDWLVFVPPHLVGPPRRSYFFDLGSTYYDEGVNGKADSLRDFLRKYRLLSGVEFDEIFAWEAKSVSQADYWQRVDLNMSHKIHFYNTRVSPVLASTMSALRMIQTLAHPDDFVVFKLDIDDNPTEVEMILTILQTPSLIDRIDELFWEHHVKGSPVQWSGWGDLVNETGKHSTIEASYQLFTRLRQAGIRAHSWV